MRRSRALLAAVLAATIAISGGCTGVTSGQRPGAGPSHAGPPPPCKTPRPALAVDPEATDLPTKAEENFGIPKDKFLWTFDDGGPAAKIDGIAAELKAEQAGAIFFFTGRAGKKSSDPCAKLKPIVERLYRQGFLVGNHSWSHPVGPRNPLIGLPAYPPKDRPKAQNIHDEIAGGMPSTCFRPPGGSLNRQVREVAAKLGYRICYWSYDTKDWNGLTADQIVANITRTAEKHPEKLRGGVILAHMHGDSQILQAMPRIYKLLWDLLKIRPCGPLPAPIRGQIPSPLPC